MEIKEYQKLAFRTCNDLNNGLANMAHMILGMQTELGEFADPYKKYWAYGKKLDKTNVKEELGDLMWYIACACEFNDWSLEDICQTNIDKLKARYPEKFTNELAINRNLDIERQILENGN